MRQQKNSFRAAVAASTFIAVVGLTACQGSTPAAANAAAALAAATTAAANAAVTAQTPRPTPPAARPAISFAFTAPTVNSGTSPKLTYSGANLPAGSEVVLQLAYGSPTDWDSAKTLSGTRGTATLPALPAGVYPFRTAVEDGLTVVAVSPTRVLSVVQPGSSSCGICSILSGVGGAIVTWLLRYLPW